jgi:hypothetical protein
MIYTRIDIGTELTETDQDRIAWDSLYDQYIKRYGLGKLYKRLLSVMKDKALIECDFVITRDRFKLTELEIKEAELKQMIETNNTGMTIEQAIIYLSKWIGYRLNPREITVTEYFNILSEYGKANKKD